MSASEGTPVRETDDVPRFWRSLEERAGSDEFLAAVQREFPVDASVWNDQSSRRSFLQRMAASLALAGMAGCGRQPDETIVPYVEQPENIVPGKPQIFASAVSEPGGAIGVLVTSHTGRPTMLEGNPKHPASGGAAGLPAQASLLELYDPDRSQTPRKQGRISSWTAFTTELSKRIERLKAGEGAGLALVTGSISSPTLLDQIGRLLEAMPKATWYVHDPLASDETRRSTELAFGRPAATRYHLENADVLFSLDSDFLTTGPARLRVAREFAGRRRVRDDGAAKMNRLYVAESTPSLTGSKADHRLPLRPSQVPAALVRIAEFLGVAVPESLAASGSLSTPEAEWIETAADDLKSAGARGLVLVGDTAPASVQALGLAINAKLGGLGTLVTLVEPIDRIAGQAPGSVEDLAEALHASKIETLVLLETNPAYTAPADLKLSELLRKAPYSVHQGIYYDETAALCTWHVPRAHSLESWSDCRAEDGTAALIQPLIAPLYDAHSVHDLVNLFLGQPQLTDVETLRTYWRKQRGGESETQFQRFWKESLHEGVVKDSAAEALTLTPRAGWANDVSQLDGERAGKDGFELVVRLDPNVLDGRLANNGWLQELPRPLTKLTWGNLAWINPEEATRLKLKSGDVVELETSAGKIRIPVWLTPGQAEGVITVHRGHGRKQAGRVGNDVGVDVSPLIPSSGAWAIPVTLKPVGEFIVPATTQMHQMMEGDPLVRTGTIEEYRESPEHPAFMSAGSHGHGHASGLSVYPEWPKEGEQWGMAIDLGACMGCNACTLACQAENNIPIVGPEQVRNGREMHWIRVDAYFSGETTNPEMYHQPVPCMHCEHAPCEVVCPVAATTHSNDGLNEMTYNRCIGTRYCSNNCPYKVRRFNFLDYHEETRSLPVLQLGQNPEVTVRSRGVMEKCTYCVQRIWNGRIQSQLEDRSMRDGDVITACQSACPTQAIVFGNVADPESRVSKVKAQSLNYSLLEELNTRPRTTYLADVRNPNPKMKT